MKLANFMKSLLKTFRKDRIEEDCRLRLNELKTLTLPAYEDASVIFKGGNKWKSERMKNHQNTFANLVKANGSRDMIGTIEKGLKQTIENLEFLSKVVDKTFNDTVAIEGMTFVKAQILQLIEAAGFVSNYARKFLNYAYTAESAEVEDSGVVFADSITPAEVKWVEENFGNFCLALQAIMCPTTELEKALENIPDVVINDDNIDSLQSTVGAIKLDPRGMGLITVRMNIIYHIGMAVAEYQTMRYRAAKEELKMLQLKKMQLELLNERKPNPALQKDIEYVEQRVQALNFRIAKTEAENGIH